MSDTHTVTIDLTLLAAHARVITAADTKRRGVDPAVAAQLHEQFVAVGRGWRDILEAWPTHTFGPTSSRTSSQAEASSALRSALSNITRPEGRWLDPTELGARTENWAATAAAARQALTTMHDLAAEYATLPAARAATGQLYAPARALSPASRQTPGTELTAAGQELLVARRQGRWIVLQPRDVHQVTEVAAAQPARTRQLRDNVRATLGAGRRAAAEVALTVARQGHVNAWSITNAPTLPPKFSGWDPTAQRDRRAEPEPER